MPIIVWAERVFIARSAREEGVAWATATLTSDDHWDSRIGEQQFERLATQADRQVLQSAHERCHLRRARCVLFQGERSRGDVVTLDVVTLPSCCDRFLV